MKRIFYYSVALLFICQAVILTERSITKKRTLFIPIMMISMILKVRERIPFLIKL
jgi:hypothetical protein